MSTTLTSRPSRFCTAAWCESLGRLRFTERILTDRCVASAPKPQRNAAALLIMCAALPITKLAARLPELVSADIKNTEEVLGPDSYSPSQIFQALDMCLPTIEQLATDLLQQAELHLDGRAVEYSLTDSLWVNGLHMDFSANLAFANNAISYRNDTVAAMKLLVTDLSRLGIGLCEFFMSEPGAFDKIAWLQASCELASLARTNDNCLLQDQVITGFWLASASVIPCLQKVQKASNVPTQTLLWHNY